MSTDGVCSDKQLLYVDGMAIGKRIEKRLTDLGWERKDLLDRVEGLTPQALSNLIRRDSKRSEWDEAIAAALDMDVMELVYGKPSMYHHATRLSVAEPEPVSKVIAEIISHANKMNQQGQWELLGQARLLERMHPNEKQRNVR